MVIETKRLITQSASAANKHWNNIRLDTTGWARWSTGNCARNWNLAIWTSCSVSSTEKDIDTRLTAIDRLSIIWKSDLTDKMKRTFFQAAVLSILLYGCTTWTLTKRLEKKLDGNYTRMLRAVLNKSWRQHPTRHQLYGHLPPITKTIQVRRTRHAGHCWRSKDELISDVLLWTPTYGRAKAGRPARTYIQQLCEDTGCNPEDPNPTTHLTNHANKLNKICWRNKNKLLINYTRTCQCWPTNKDLPTSDLCGYWMRSKRFNWSDGW